MSWTRALLTSTWIVLALSVAASGSTPCADGHADTVYINGQILTMGGPSVGPVSAVAVRGERIVGVGSDDGIRQACVDPDQTEIYDLEQRTVTPGFIDSHSHLMPFGLASTWIDVSNINPFMRFPFAPITTNRELLQRLRAKTPKKGMPFLGAAYDPTRMNDPQITAKDLDQVSETQSIMLWHSSMHAMSLNTRASERALAALRAQGQCGGSAAQAAKASSGLGVDPKFCEALESEGLLEEQALMTVLPELPFILGLEESDTIKILADLVEGAIRGVQLYARHGFTTGSDITTAPIMHAWSKVAERIDLPLDVILLPTDPKYCKAPPSGVDLTDRLQLGPVKLFADGSPQGLTAKMSEPYFGEDGKPTTNTGEYNMPVEDLQGLAQATFDAECRLAVHTNGDQAIETMLEIIDEVQGTQTGWAPIFIHAQFSSESHLDRMKALGIFPTFLVQHPNFWGDALCRTAIGPGRMTNYDPAVWAEATGLNFSLHHDAFVTPPNPMRMLWASVTREVQQLPWNQDRTPPDDGSGESCPEVLGPDQRLTIERGLEALTLGAAQQYGIDSEKGSLEVGKLADLAILSANPLSFSEDPEGLKEIRVLATVHRGRLWRWN